MTPLREDLPLLVLEGILSYLAGVEPTDVRNITSDAVQQIEGGELARFAEAVPEWREDTIVALKAIVHAELNQIPDSSLQVLMDIWTPPTVFKDLQLRRNSASSGEDPASHSTASTASTASSHDSLLLDDAYYNAVWQYVRDLQAHYKVADQIAEILVQDSSLVLHNEPGQAGDPKERIRIIILQTWAAKVIYGHDEEWFGDFELTTEISDSLLRQHQARVPGIDSRNCYRVYWALSKRVCSAPFRPQQSAGGIGQQPHRGESDRLPDVDEFGHERHYAGVELYRIITLSGMEEVLRLLTNPDRA